MDALNKKTIVTDISKFCGPALISLAFAILSLVSRFKSFLMSGFRDLKGLGGGISGLMGGLWSLALHIFMSARPYHFSLDNIIYTSNICNYHVYDNYLRTCRRNG